LAIPFLSVKKLCSLDVILPMRQVNNETKKMYIEKLDKQNFWSILVTYIYEFIEKRFE